MRKQWFGDSRDYVKWSCILAEAGKDLSVIYGPMLRPDSLLGEKLDPKVTSFFDKHKDFSVLAELFPAGFTYLPDRYEIKFSDEYFNVLTTRIAAAQLKSQVLVFLDPDTGVEPKTRAENEHLRECDIRRVCELLRSGDKLVVYQHASRTKAWMEKWSDRLLLLAAQTTTTLSAPYYEEKTAKDVCFFTFTKN
jgi:hypothetical protein